MPKINAGGYLTSLAQKVLAGQGPEYKLNTAQLERIATYLGYLAKDHDLYDLLFTQNNQLLTVDGDDINTKDLMWFTIMDHECARGWFWKPVGRAPLDTSVCNGVPLAFKGARRVFNKPYMKWWDDVKDDKDKYIQCDIFLPKGLNSYFIDDEGEPQVETEAGLIRLMLADIEFTNVHIHRLREIVDRFAVTSKPKKVKPLDISENKRFGEVYNKCSYLMRCMILEGWCWTLPTRNSDMITDYNDWDNLKPSIDAPGNAMKGLKPKESNIAPGYSKFANTTFTPVPEEEEYHHERKVL